MKKMRLWLEKKGLEKWFQRDNLIILVLSGILLFIIALPIDGADENKKETDGVAADTSLWGAAGQQAEKSAKGSGSTAISDNNTHSNNIGIEETDYAGYLEERLEGVLCGMSGVGKVEVMITLQSSEELIVEKDEPMIRSDVIENDSEGGSRNTSQLETRETTIYKTEGSNSEPYVVKTILPKVEGVLVVAEGAGTGTVSKSITEIVQALFDVEVHKIKVVKMEESK